MSALRGRLATPALLFSGAVLVLVVLGLSILTSLTTPAAIVLLVIASAKRNKRLAVIAGAMLLINAYPLTGFSLLIGSTLVFATVRSRR